MKATRVFRAFASIAALALCIAPLAFAQMGGGMGPGPGRHRTYNPATETTVKGTVDEVKTVAGRGAGAGIHLVLKTESETLDVHLGPAAYLQKQNFELTKGDQVEVTGSKVQFQGHHAIIAREVKKGDKVLTLRDANGFPAWSRARARN